MKRALAVIVAVLVFVVGCSNADPEVEAAVDIPFEVVVTVASPDNQLTVEVGTDELGRPRYRVVRIHADGQPETVIDDSTLGIEATADDGTRLSLAAGSEINDEGTPRLVTDSFDLPTGKARSASIEAVAQRVTFAGFDDRSDAELAVDFWVADDAVAFRYVLEADAHPMPRRIEWERTSFAVAPESRAWLQRRDAPGAFTPGYERLRRGALTAGAPGRVSHGWNFPALFASERSWTLITEADIGEGDGASHLSSVVDDAEYFLDLADRAEGNGIGDPRPMVEPGWSSPWRLIVTSPNLADIVESDHVRHLSTPADDRDWSWVEPGRVSWSWWSDSDSSRDPEAIEPFIDLAADLGWEYSLVDANWNGFDDERLIELIGYATERNVDLLLWYNSGGPNNVVTEAPRDRMFDREVRRDEFERIAALGIRGVKVDFFHSDKPDRMQQYRDILDDAADFELLVNFHGSTLPRGWSREFPHLMTMEAVRGAEIYKFDTTYGAAVPSQNTILPFTRNVVGSMDFTPVMVGDEFRRRTGTGHELALSVVFESGLQHFVDTPVAYGGLPDVAYELMATVPTAWDETVFIEGEPERHVALARRIGSEWWIGAINGTADAVTVSLPVDRLGIEAEATVTRVCDAPDWDFTPGLASTWNDPAQFSIGGGLAPLELAPFGGCLIRVG